MRGVLATVLAGRWVLSGCVLARRILSGCVVARRILSRCVLARRILSGCVLARRILSGCVLARRKLRRCVLARRILSRCVLARLVLRGCIKVSRLLSGCVLVLNSLFVQAVRAFRAFRDVEIRLVLIACLMNGICRLFAGIDFLRFFIRHLCGGIVRDRFSTLNSGGYSFLFIHLLFAKTQYSNQDNEADKANSSSHASSNCRNVGCFSRSRVIVDRSN